MRILIAFQLYKYATIFSIIFLPKSISPKFEFFDMLTRDEVLASWKPQKYLKEKKDAEEAKERERQQDANKIKHDNEQLLQKVCPHQSSYAALSDQ